MEIESEQQSIRPMLSPQINAQTAKTLDLLSESDVPIVPTLSQECTNLALIA